MTGEAFEEGRRQGARDERTRIVLRLRHWADEVVKGHLMVSAGGDEERIRALRDVADAIEKGETSPSFAR